MVSSALDNLLGFPHTPRRIREGGGSFKISFKIIQNFCVAPGFSKTTINSIELGTIQQSSPSIILQPTVIQVSKCFDMKHSQPH